MLFRIGRKRDKRLTADPNISYNIIHYVIEKTQKDSRT